MTVSEPPLLRLRPAASARRAAPAGRYSKPSISSTASPPRAATRRPVSTACSTAWACASLDAAKLSAALGATGNSRDLLRAHAGQHRAHLEARDGRQRAREPPQRLALAGARRARDDHARALAERRQPLDRADRQVLGAQRDALVRPRDRQVLEARALGDLLGRAAVDGLDADQRREALGPAGRADRAADLVAGDELAALDLGGGDVDVIVGRLGRRQAQEAGAVGEQLDASRRPTAPRDRRTRRSRSRSRRRGRSGGHGLLVLTLDGRAVVLVAAPATPATAPTAGALGLIVAVALGRPRRRPRAPRRARPPRRTRSGARGSRPRARACADGGNRRHRAHWRAGADRRAGSAPRRSDPGRKALRTPRTIGGRPAALIVSGRRVHGSA